MSINAASKLAVDFYAFGLRGCPQRPSLSLIIQRLLTQPARVSTGWGKQRQAVDWTLAIVIYAQVGRPIKDLSTGGPTLKYRCLSMEFTHSSYYNYVMDRLLTAG